MVLLIFLSMMPLLWWKPLSLFPLLVQTLEHNQLLPILLLSFPIPSALSSSAPSPFVSRNTSKTLARAIVPCGCIVFFHAIFIWGTLVSQFSSLLMQPTIIPTYPGHPLLLSFSPNALCVCVVGLSTPPNRLLLLGVCYAFGFDICLVYHSIS